MNARKILKIENQRRDPCFLLREIDFIGRSRLREFVGLPRKSQGRLPQYQYALSNRERLLQ
jgi:hypothetical protein